MPPIPWPSTIPASQLSPGASPPIVVRTEPHPIDLHGERIEIGAPVEPGDAATKQFVQDAVGSVAAPLIVTVNCPSTILPGQLLKVVGPGSVDLTTCLSPAPALGVLTASRQLQTGGVATGFTNLVPGKMYYAGPDGWPSLAPIQVASGTRVYLQKIGVAIMPDTLILIVSLDIYSYVQV